MATLRGLTTCDRCYATKLYADWPTCRECGKDICPTCVEPHTLHEADLDDPATCVCVDCEPEADAPSGTVEDATGADRS